MAQRCPVAIFGVGRIGQVHLRNLALGGRVTIKWLVEVQPAHARIAELVALLRLTSESNLITPEEADKVFKDNSVKAVIICTPHDSHEEFIKAALRSGKHVFCEKPLSTTLDRVVSCYAVAKETGHILFAGFNRRFDPSIKELQRDIQSKMGGSLRMIRFCSREPQSVSTTAAYLKFSGGLVLDSMIHELDLICWMTGERPKSVMVYGHAHGQIFQEMNDVDGACIMMKFPSGCIGFIEKFRGSTYGFDDRYEAYGSDGSMLKREFSRPSQVTRCSSDGITSNKQPDDLIGCFNEAYRLELESFLNIVSGKEACTILPEEVVFTSKLIEYCNQSLSTGQVVQIQE